MQRLTEKKIIVVTREVRLEGLRRRFNTKRQAKFYVEHLGGDFSDYTREQETYQAAVTETETILRSLGMVQFIDRAFLPNFVFGPEDIVVVLGQDGLVANTLKYTGDRRWWVSILIPKRFDGVLLPFLAPDLKRVMPETLANRRACKLVTMAKAELNDGRTLHAVNDFFVGPRVARLGTVRDPARSAERDAQFQRCDRLDGVGIDGMAEKFVDGGGCHFRGGAWRGGGKRRGRGRAAAAAADGLGCRLPVFYRA